MVNEGQMKINDRVEKPAMLENVMLILMIIEDEMWSMIVSQHMIIPILVFVKMINHYLKGTTNNSNQQFYNRQ